MEEQSKPDTEGEIVEITLRLPRAFWEQVKQNAKDYARVDAQDPPEIVIQALENCLHVRRTPFKSAIDKL